MRVPCIAAGFLLLSATAASASCPAHRATVLHDGSVRIDGIRYADDRALKAGLRKLRCGGKNVYEVEFDPVSSVTYEALAKALAMFQKSGEGKIGFVNVPTEQDPAQ